MRATCPANTSAATLCSVAESHDVPSFESLCLLALRLSQVDLFNFNSKFDSPHVWQLPNMMQGKGQDHYCHKRATSKQALCMSPENSNMVNIQGFGCLSIYLMIKNAFTGGTAASKAIRNCLTACHMRLDGTVLKLCVEMLYQIDDEHKTALAVQTPIMSLCCQVSQAKLCIAQAKQPKCH